MTNVASASVGLRAFDGGVHAILGGSEKDEPFTPLLEPIRDFRALEERIENTVDYFVVSNFVKALSALRPRRLLETLAEEITTELLACFPLQAVEIELRKFILPDTAFVAIQLRRERAP